jgi:hypothetical protein
MGGGTIQWPAYLASSIFFRLKARLMLSGWKIFCVVFVVYRVLRCLTVNLNLCIIWDSIIAGDLQMILWHRFTRNTTKQMAICWGPEMPPSPVRKEEGGGGAMSPPLTNQEPQNKHKQTSLTYIDAISFI